MTPARALRAWGQSLRDAETNALAIFLASVRLAPPHCPIHSLYRLHQ